MNQAVSGSCDHQSSAQQLETTYITPLRTEQLKQGEEEESEEGEVVQQDEQSETQSDPSKTARAAGSD